MVRRSNAIACFRTYPVIFSIRAYVGTSLRANQISMCCNKDVLRMSVHPLFIDLRNIPPDDWRVFSVSVRKHAKPSLGFTYVSSMRGNAARMLPTAQFPYPTPVHALPCLRMSSERKHTHTHTHTDRQTDTARDTETQSLNTGAGALLSSHVPAAARKCPSGENSATSTAPFNPFKK